MVNLLSVLIESIDLTIYSYVKPGMMHRYSSHFRDLHKFSRYLTCSLDVYLGAINYGQRVAQGRATFPSVPVGSLISEALNDTARAVGRVEIPSYHLILVPSVIAVAYSHRQAGALKAELFRRATADLLNYNPPKESVAVYTALKRHGGILAEKLSTESITSTKIEVEKLTLHDIYSRLADVDRALKTYIKGLGTLISCGKVFTNTVSEKEDRNAAAVETYFCLAKELGLRHVAVGKSLSLLELLKLDKELIKKGVDLTFMFPLLNLSILVGLLGGGQ